MLQIPIQTRTRCSTKSKPMTLPSVQDSFRRPIVACKNAQVHAKLLWYSRHKKLYITCAKAFVVESVETAYASDGAVECPKVEACSSTLTCSPSWLRNRRARSSRPWFRIRCPLRTRLLPTPMSWAVRLLVAHGSAGVYAMLVSAHLMPIRALLTVQGCQTSRRPCCSSCRRKAAPACAF